MADGIHRLGFPPLESGDHIVYLRKCGTGRAQDIHPFPPGTLPGDGKRLVVFQDFVEVFAIAGGGNQLVVNPPVTGIPEVVLQGVNPEVDKLQKVKAGFQEVESDPVDQGFRGCGLLLYHVFIAFILRFKHPVDSQGGRLRLLFKFGFWTCFQPENRYRSDDRPILYL